MDDNRLDLTAALARAAVDGKPSVFAIYGTYKEDPLEPLLGWGMELPAGGGALFRLAGGHGIHSADSADAVFDIQSIIGDVHLAWLDPQPEPRAP